MHLHRNRHVFRRLERRVDAAVEALAMIRSVELVPRQPEMLLHTNALEIPRQAVFERSIVGESLALKRWQQAMWSCPIRPERNRRGLRRQRTENKRRTASA